ncbi:MAG: non-ribosomal peptide synthetase, partial [Gemmatimonadetes bacterium]|nr:non-ribosomal peptide synthetase [Gemmatimonadota bacterium]
QVKVRGFRIEPGEIEAALRRHPALRDAVVAARMVDGEKRLAAWVVPVAEAPTVDDLRAFLTAHLPEYMVPTLFATVDAFPLTPAGKVDKRRLPEPQARRLAAGSEYVAPRTPAEATLAAIWADVLRLPRVGVHDNFFTLGGDSIVSIQVIARANQAHLRITPRLMFAHQTVAQLAAAVGDAAAHTAEQGIVTGPAPLTPVQQWWFAQGSPEPHHFNLAAAYATRAPLDAEVLARACAAVVAHHDALRMRYLRGEDGAWTQANADAGDPVPFAHLDLRGVPAAEREAAFTARVAELQRSLDLAAGPLVRFALVEMGDEQRFVLVSHHLVMDAVSLSLVAGDVEAAYRRLAAGEDAGLPRKSTSFRQWATRLAEHARTGEVRAQAPYWLEQGDAPPLPVADAEDLEGQAEHVDVTLGQEETRGLLADAHVAYQTTPPELMLAAVARAVRGWTGARAVLVDVEGHGREDLFDGVDLSRTVGWFTAIHPLRLELPDDDAPAAAIKAVKEQVRGVPGRGISHGLLRWLSGDAEIRALLAARPRPSISFNYLGRLDGGEGGDSLFAGIEADLGPARSPVAPRSHAVQVDAGVAGGRLHATFTFAPRRVPADQVRRLAEGFAAELAALVAHCRDPRAGGYTPSDFEMAGLDQAGLDALLAGFGGEGEG